MSVRCLDWRNACILRRLGCICQVLVRSEAVSWPLIAALLLLTVCLLDYSQPVFPLGVRKLESAPFARVCDNDFWVIVPVDTEQTLQMAVGGMQSRQIEKGLYSVVLDMFPSCDYGEDVEELGSDGGYIQEIEEHAVCAGQHSLGLGFEDVVDLDEPLQKRTLEIERRPQHAEAQGADDAQDDMCRDFVDGIQTPDNGVQTALVQVGPGEGEVDKLEQLVGKKTLAIGHRGQLGDLGLDISGALLG